ncbi:MAG: sulfatase-like hydrolase/transferase [Acinetobacter sp.]
MGRKFLELYSFPIVLSMGYCVGLGFWDYLLEINDSWMFILPVTISVFFFIFVQQSENKLGKILALALCSVMLGYMATAAGFLQGHMSIGIIASIFQTNTNEALEFLSVIHYKFLLYVVILGILTFYYLCSYQTSYKLAVNKYLIAFLCIFNVFNVFLIQTANAALKYKKEEKILNEGNAEEVNWEISKSSPKYSTQVFILGESVQRDYLSLHGFKEKTTPFLDRMPVQYVENYISTAPNTATSLSRTLAYMDQGRNIKSSMNVMTLAKQAGYNTIWISNQGFVGKNDTAVSKIGIHAEHQLFLKSGNYQSKNKDDNELIALLDQQIKKYPKQNNVIFLHMMGSHPDACERLFDSPRLYPQYPEAINCYLSSINKMDAFLESVHGVLSKTGKSFSMAYFSDHGMTVNNDSYHVDNNSKANYEVPFIVLSSDQTVREKLDKSISAYDFMNIYAGMLGVETPYLDQARTLRKIENNPHITVFDWDDYLPYASLSD